MTGAPKPFSRLFCAALVLAPLAALLSIPFVAQRFEERKSREQAEARATELYERVIAAVNEGEMDEAESALFDARSEAPDHPSRAASEQAVRRMKQDQLLLRAGDTSSPASLRRNALIELASLDPEQSAVWLERAAELDDDVEQEARQARAQARIDAMLAEADAEPEGGRYVPQREVLPPGFECGRKNSCNQMKSCAEAVAYFEKCQVQRLDPDADGRPCEDLCTWRELGND